MNTDPLFQSDLALRLARIPQYWMDPSNFLGFDSILNIFVPLYGEKRMEVFLRSLVLSQTNFDKYKTGPYRQFLIKQRSRRA